MAETRKKRLPWGKALLIASLAGNLLVIGLVVGAMTHDRRGDTRSFGLSEAGFGPYAAALSRDDRAALGLALRREDGPFRARRAEMRGAFDGVVAALRAEPYDHAALAAAIAAQEALVQATQMAARDLLLDHIGQMDLEERRAYAGALEAWRSKRGRPDRRGD